MEGASFGDIILWQVLDMEKYTVAHAIYVRRYSPLASVSYETSLLRRLQAQTAPR